MKRFIFSAIALMVAVTSCTESGIIDKPEFYQNPIVFDTYIGKAPVTKAVNCDIQQLQAATGGVHIYGFKSDKVSGRPYDYVDYSSAYLNGELRYTATNWKYYENGSEVEAYMPTDKDLAVAAYNLQASGSSYMSNISEDKTEFDFTIQDAVSTQVDLLVTPLTFVTETGETTQVPLRFYHLLSRVGFKVQSTGNSNTAIEISSIKLKGQYAKKGRVDMKLAIATPNSSSSQESNIILKDDIRPEITPILSGANPYQAEYELLPGNDNVFQTTADVCYTEAQQITPEEGGCYMMIMPGIQKEASVEIVYKLGNSEERSATIDLAALNDINYFEAGYAYEFIFKLSTSAIEFSGEVIEGDWDTPTSEDI